MKTLKNPDPLLSKEIKDELFKESNYVDKLFNFLTTKIEPPFSISIDGDWGTGKTTIMKLIEGKLNQDYPTFWFNPWEYKSSSDVVLSFLKNLAIKFPNELGMKSENVGRFFQLLAVSGIDFVSRVISNGYLSVEMVEKNSELLKEEIPKWKTHHNMIDEIKNEFVKLTNVISSKCENKPLFIFLDDFDRCFPDDTIKLLEAMKNLFLAKNDKDEVASTIFICGINTDVAKYFIREHYKLGEDKEDYALNYFRKIFNLTFNIPNPVSFHNLVKKYFDDLEIGGDNDSSKFINMIIDDGSYLRINSIRKYQNIVNNFFITTQLNNVKPFLEKQAILKLLFIKEVDYNLYQRLKLNSIKHRDVNFRSLIKNILATKESISPYPYAKEYLQYFAQIQENLDEKPIKYFCEYLV